MKKLISEYLRPFLSPSNNESVSQCRVHGEHWATMCFGHHPDQEMFSPYIHVSIYGTSERQVVLKQKYY